MKHWKALVALLLVAALTSAKITISINPEVSSKVETAVSKGGGVGYTLVKYLVIGITFGLTLYPIGWRTIQIISTGGNIWQLIFLWVGWGIALGASEILGLFPDEIFGGADAKKYFQCLIQSWVLALVNKPEDCWGKSWTG
jgi:hypothetical protein